MRLSDQDVRNRTSMQTSPYDENWNLELYMLAIQMQLNHPMTYSIVDLTPVPTCEGRDAKLVATPHGERM